MNSTSMLLDSMKWAMAQAADRMAASAGTKSEASAEGSNFKKLLSQKTQPEIAKTLTQPTAQQDGTTQTATAEQDAVPDAQMLAAALMMQPMVVLMDEPPVATMPQDTAVAVPVLPTAEAPQPAAETAQPQKAMPNAGSPEVLSTAAEPNALASAHSKPTAVEPQAAPQAEITPKAEFAAAKTAPAQPENEKKDEIPLQRDAEPVFREVTHLPIKVGQAEPVVEAEAADLDAQMAKQIGKACETGETKLKIALSPETFGTVTIEMTRTQDGALRLLMTASTERGQTLLEKHASGLQGMLAESSRAPVQVEVQRQSESQWTQHSYDRESSSGGQQQQRRQQQNQNRDFLERLRLGLDERESFSL